jgi:4-hydroxy-3-polyprenylbenzoate decarboxylase
LFENTGYDFPVLMNAYGSERRMCLALGVQHLDDVAKEIENLFKLLSAPKEGILDKLKMLPKLSQFASWMPTVKSGKGECQEIVMREPDITKLPGNSHAGQKMEALLLHYLLFIQKIRIQE